jgi:hypothetical protein
MLSKYVLNFFYNANRSEESVATTQAKPVVEQNNLMVDFVRGFVGDVVNKKKRAQELSDELDRLNLQMKRYADPDLPQEIRDNRMLVIKNLHREELNDCERRKLGLLLSIETDPTIRSSIIEDMLMSEGKIRQWRNVAQMMMDGSHFLAESEIEKIKKSQESLKESLGQTFAFNVRIDMHEIERQYVMLTLIDDKDKRKKIIATIIHIFQDNFFWIAPLHLLRIAIDKLNREEVALFLPVLSTALNAKTVPYRMDQVQIEHLQTQVLCLLIKIKQLNLVTEEDLLKHKIALPIDQPEYKLTEWKEILLKAVQSKEQPTLSVLQISSLEKVICQKGNDEILSLLMDCILENTVCDGHKRLVSQFTLFSSLSFALSQVFKKGYFFASEDTKEKIQNFLLDQFFCPYQKMGSFMFKTPLATYTEMIDLMQFVMSKMPDDSKRAQYLEKIIEKRRLMVKKVEKSDQWEWEASDKLIVMLTTHGMRLHQNELKVQALGSVLEDNKINFPK